MGMHQPLAWVEPGTGPQEGNKLCGAALPPHTIYFSSWALCPIRATRNIYRPSFNGGLKPAAKSMWRVALTESGTPGKTRCGCGAAKPPHNHISFPCGVLNPVRPMRKSSLEGFPVAPSPFREHHEKLWGDEAAYSGLRRAKYPYKITNSALFAKRPKRRALARP